ncbi:MAG: class I SAM-dependent methyltransferase [Pirellula sp.]
MSSISFDDFADQYESALQRGLSASGESSAYFASGRIQWLKKRLREMGAERSHTEMVLDFGCGTGNSVPILLDQLGAKLAIGLDTSEQSLVQARASFAKAQPQAHSPAQTGSSTARFENVATYKPAGDVDVAFCNGVFHHIPLDERANALGVVFRSLRPSGWFAFWENNPWNPGTRYVMSKIPFDRDANTLSILQSRRMLVCGGFAIKRIDSCFYFPKSLRWFRRFESGLAWLPLGAQYLILAQKL